MVPMKLTRISVVAFVFFLLVNVHCPVALNAASQGTKALLADQQIERHGLTRAWFNQVEMDPVRHKVEHVIEEGGTLFIVSDDAKLHAIDSETGKSLWRKPFGGLGMNNLEPSANSRMVAVSNGLEVFIYNRKNGKLLFQARLPGAASTACEISEHYLYAPLLNDRIVAYPLDENRFSTEDETTAAKPATEDNAPPVAPRAETEKEGDPVLDSIVKSFAETKNDLLAEPVPPKKEPEIVLQGPLGIPMATQTFGNVLVKPIIATQAISYTPQGRPLKHQEIVMWVNDRGAMLAAGIESFSQEKFDLRFMVDSNAESFFMDSNRIARREWKGNQIAVRPTVNQSEPLYYMDNKAKDLQIPSLVVAGNLSGYVFAVKDRVGEVLWKFSASGPVKERIAVVGKDVYCPISPSGMHALDVMTGDEKWYATGVRKFVAASIKRLYVIDKDENLVVLNRETGVPVSSFSVRNIDRFFFNLETDRIFAVTDSGLVQCLRERRVCGNPDCRGKESCPHTEALTKPILHRLTCKQYADVMKGAPAPNLYWMTSAEGEVKPEAAPEVKPEEGSNDDPFAAPAKKKTGENGDLGGDEEMEAKPKPKKAADTKEEEDPFQ